MSTEAEPPHLPEPEPPEHDPDIMAAELVLGLLGPGEPAQEAATPAFNRAVDAWQDRLAPLLDEVALVAPPPRLWTAIQAAIGDAPASTQHRPGLWNSLRFWRGFGFGAGALGAAGLAAAAVLLLDHPVPRPFATATLATSDSGAFIAVAQKQGGDLLLLVSPARVTVPAGKAAELWLLRPDAEPQPLGLLASQHAVVVTLANTTSASLAAAHLAISLEPPGGSPDGTVTGPVIAVAKFTTL